MARRRYEYLLAGLVPVAASAACGDTFGESRLRLHATADGSQLWQRDFDVERVYVPSTTPAGELLVRGADDCGGRDFVSEYDKETGEKLADLPEPPLDLPGSYDPPATCPSLRERVSLSSGDRVDICDQESGEGELALRDVATGALRATVPAEDYWTLLVAGDYLFVKYLSVNDGSLASAVDVVALQGGEVQWRWEGPGEVDVLGADGDRAYLWDAANDVHSLALADGSPVWRDRLDCNWITLLGDVLACDQKLRESSCQDTDKLFYLGPSRP